MGTGLRVLPSVLLVGYAALVTVPAAPEAIGTGIASNWQLGANLMHAQGLSFGTDVAWTFGPLSYLSYPASACGEPGLAFGFRYGIWLGGVLLLAAFHRLVPQRGVAAVVTLTLVLAPELRTDATPEQLERLVVTSALLAASQRRVFWPAAAVTAVGTALCTLQRFTSGVACGWIVAALLARVVLSDVGSRRASVAKAAGIALLVPAALVAACAALNGGASTALPFIATSVELARGYGEGMGLDGSGGVRALGAAAVAALFVLVPIASRDRRALAPGLALAGGLAFLHWQHAFVRQGLGHEVGLLPNLAVDALFVLAAASCRRDRVVVSVVVAALLGGGALLDEARVPSKMAQLGPTLRLRSVRWRLEAAREWSGGWRRREQRSRELLSSWKIGPQLRERLLGRSVTTVPSSPGMAWVNDLSWRPLPVLQLYAAYTPELDTRCARAVGAGAGSMLLTNADLDGCHPFFRAARTWRAIVDGHALLGATAHVLAAEPRLAPKYADPVEIRREAVGWGEERAVPQHEQDLTLVEIGIERSARGRLRSAVSRVAPIHIETTYQSGRRATWRAIRPTIAAGVIIGVVPKGNGELAQLLGDGELPRAARVATIRFDTTSPGDYDARISLRWLRLPRRSASPAP